MSKLCMGSIATPNDPALSKSYCEGRRAAVLASGTNPHRSGTPEADAWDRGHSTYESSGTVTFRDCCADLAKIAARTLTGVATDLSVTFTVSPAIPCEIDPGDGTPRIDAPAGGAVHVYAAEGDYTAIAYLGGYKLDDVVVSPTEPAP